VGAKPTQTTSSSKPDAREVPHVEIAVSQERDVSPDDCAGTSKISWIPAERRIRHNDNDDEDTDGQASSGSLFSNEADSNSSDTDSSLDVIPERIHKRHAGGAVAESQELRAGSSKDMPIVLEEDGPIVDPDHKQGAHLGFDERIPISLSVAEWSNGVDNAASHSTTEHNPSRNRKRKRGSESARSDSEDPISPNMGGHGRAVDGGAPQHTDSNDHRSEPQPVDSPGPESTKETRLSSPPATHHSADHGLEEAQSEVVWKYTRLLGYNVVNGKPYVLVRWCPTWEPFEEFPTEEVETVKQQYESPPFKRRRRVPLKTARGTCG